MNLSFRHYYWRWLKNLAFLFIIFVCLATLARLSFAIYFGEPATLLERTNELRKAFWLGFRYDLMPLAYINAIPFLLLNLGYFLPGKISIKIIRFLIIGILSLGYFFLCWLYVADYGFYSYFQEHLNILFFGLFEDDTVALIISIFKNYNVPLWLFILGIVHYGLYRLIKFLFSPFEFDLKARRFDFKLPLAFISGSVLLALMARGNFSRLPLSIEDSYISDNEFINEIAATGALSLNRAIKIRKTFGKGNFDYLKRYGFKNWKDAYTSLVGTPPKGDFKKSLSRKTAYSPLLEENPPHVVLVVMESFGSYWNDIDSEDFQLLGELKDHFKKGDLFKNFLPAENGTIGSIVSVATSLPIRPGSRFLSESEFMHTPISSAGHLPFKNNGYETHFVYGGKLGWRDLGKYLAVQKYDYLWGADEIRDRMPELNNLSERDLGNEWGIFDEYLYSFIEEQLRTARKPQFFLVLTTSNHPPFEYPTSYQPKPLNLSDALLEKMTIGRDLARKRFSGFQYANQKVGEFLTRIHKSSLVDKTIVALTGDHSFWVARGVGQDQEFKRYAVPFYLSIPERYRPASVDTSKFGSHEDIFPTLYNLSLSNASYIGFGENIISENSFAMNSSGLVANKEGAAHHGKFWKWVDRDNLILEEVEPTPELKRLERRGKAMISLADIFLKSEKSGRLPDEEDGQQ